MGHVRRILAALVGVAALGGASVATEDCGSEPADVDGAAQDASVDHVDAGIGWDALSDAGTPPRYVACPDAGFITIDGDGPTQTVRSNVLPPVEYATIPAFPWSQAYYGQGLAMGGSESPDGGASLIFDIEIQEDADGGLTVLGPGPKYSYAYYTRHDGTSFSPTSGASASVTLTQADPPGGIVVGSYTAIVVDSTQPDAAPISLSGTFSTCRLWDWSGPTPAHP